MNERECRVIVKRRAVAFDPTLDAWQPHAPCERCGTFTDGFELHHRLFRSRGGKWTPANILLLCKKCHDEATDELTSDGVNVSTGDDPREVPVDVWYAGCVLLDDYGGWQRL